MLKLRKIKPLFSQVLVTENVYGYDDRDHSGIIVHKKGDIMPYQTVVAVGDDVKQVKPGDKVKINYYKYAELQEDPNSIKAMHGNKMVKLRLREVEMEDENGDPAPCFIIDLRDIEYIIQEGEEVAYKDDDTTQKVSLILPNKKVIY